MTHFQELFIRNLRFFRKKKGISQLKFSEKIAISPNYLNAIENGKNFPSPEVIQAIINSLEIMPFHLFFEMPVSTLLDSDSKETKVIQELINIKQKLVKEIEDIIQTYQS